MKRTLAFILAGLIAISLVACGGNGDESKAEGSSEEAVVGDESKAEESSEEAVVKVADPLEVMENVWSAHTEDETFPAMGGDNMVQGKPGVYSIDDSATLDNILAYPQAKIDGITSAVSLIHMMNANTFTAGAYHLADGANATDIASAIRTNIQSRQWMCGFPDKLIVIVIDECLVSAFGNEELIDNFKNHLTATYSDATIVYDEAIGY